MRKAEKVKRILAILAQLYPETPIPLAHTDPYTLLIAVLLSAQCTDKRVNLVTPALFARADTPAKMILLTVDEIYSLIRTCGLGPNKSKAIYELSKIIVEQYGGHVPNTFEALEALPGVGHKTASVVMIQAFGVPAFPVDTHIHRLASRWGLTSGKSREQTERDLKRLLPKSEWATLHLRMIFFGREHCPALRHNPCDCPICSWTGHSDKNA